MIVRVDGVRFAFCFPFTARAQSADKPNDKKFSTASLHADPNPDCWIVPSEADKALGVKPEKTKLLAAIDRVAKEKWGVKAEGIVKALRLNHKALYVNGDTKAQHDGFAGSWFFNASAAEAKPPMVKDQFGNDLAAASGKPYSGAYGTTLVDIWAQDNAHGQRINGTLMAVQFRKDGDAFGGGGKVADASMFDYEDGNDASDLA